MGGEGRGGVEDMGTGQWTGFQNKGTIQGFIGLLTFPSKFIPNLSELSLLLFPLLLERKIVTGTFWSMD